MADDAIKPGELVRFHETASRWLLALVKRVSGADVDLEFASGGRATVPSEQVESFKTYLQSKTNVYSKTREKLSEHFFGEVFTRLPKPRADQMKKFLRTNGYSFEPEEWAAGERVRIWPDASHVRAEKSSLDRDFEALLPQWLEPHRLPAGSRDPLGFQSHAERLASEFLPGVTVFTTKIAYYGFIAWASKLLSEMELPRETSRRELFHRLERAFVLCEFIFHGREDNDCRVIGQRSKSEVLQLHTNERFKVPPAIMKNQESGGSLRLYSTSMTSCGFAESRPEKASEGHLPLDITALGETLGREFGRWVPDGFVDFALGERAEQRDTLRQWGRNLCSSTFGAYKYRKPFLEGFIKGNSREAEARYKTVSLLAQHGLIAKSEDQPRKGLDTVHEEDAGVADDDSPPSVTNADVLLHFYRQPLEPSVAAYQKAAVFELLSLGQTAIFAAATDVLTQNGRGRIEGLHDAIVESPSAGRFWRESLSARGRLPDVIELHDALFAAASAVDRAAAGGALLRRVMQDPVFQKVAPDLVGTPALELLETLSPAKSLADSFPRLMEAMVARHEQVSINKSRQRWCYLDGADLVADDIQPLGVGWHAMRFPQVALLCADVQLTAEDLQDGQ